MEPLQLRHSVLKDTHVLLHQPYPRLEKKQPRGGWRSLSGVPWEPSFPSNFMLCQAGGVPGPPSPSWKLLAHTFWPATHKSERFGLPSRCVYFCPEIFWPSCSSTTYNPTYDLTTQGNSISPSVASGLSSQPMFKQHDNFRVHTRTSSCIFCTEPTANVHKEAQE